MTAAIGPHVCSTCGRTYLDTTDDRIRHRMLLGHTPSHTPAPTQTRGHTSSPCHRGRHNQCGAGVLMGSGFTGACACWCHGTEE